MDISKGTINVVSESQGDRNHLLGCLIHLSNHLLLLLN